MLPAPMAAAGSRTPTIAAAEPRTLVTLIIIDLLGDAIVARDGFKFVATGMSAANVRFAPRILMPPGREAAVSATWRRPGSVPAASARPASGPPSLSRGLRSSRG